MSEINVQLNDGAAIPVPSSTTVAEALKKLDRDLAKQALVAPRIAARLLEAAIAFLPLLANERRGVLRHGARC